MSAHRDEHDGVVCASFFHCVEDRSISTVREIFAVDTGEASPGETSETVSFDHLAIGDRASRW